MAHLIFLTSTPTDVASGSGTWVGISVLRDAVLALGHQVTLIAPPPGEREPTLSRIVFNWRARQMVRRTKADVLIGFDLDGVFVRRRALFHVAAIKGVLADEARFERGGSRVALTIQSWLEAQHVRRADRVITTSHYSSERIAQFYGLNRDRISIVPEAIDFGRWQQSFLDPRRETHRPRILCVAHLYPRKRVDTLLRAFARLEMDVELRIVGVGPEKPHLEKLAAALGTHGRVRFLGQVPFNDLVAEYRNATVFALPTSQEGFGIVFLEAMASSLPIIAGDAGAVPEVVEAGVSALLVKPDDDAGLSDALTRVLNDRDLRVALAKAGLARVRRYDSPIVARQFLGAIGL